MLRLDLRTLPFVIVALLVAVTAATIQSAGVNYSSATTAVVIDDNGLGPGTGAVVALTIVGGAITGEERLLTDLQPSRERIRDVFRETVRTGIGRRSEFRFLLPDSSVRHIESEGRAILGPDGKVSKVTYQQLYNRVCKFANALKGLGVRKGDRINIYLPMIPEAAVAMLACARIGAAHSVVFGGFSAQSLTDRINDAEAKVLITADGGWRRGEVFPLKKQADESLQSTPSIESVVVVKRGRYRMNSP